MPDLREATDDEVAQAPARALIFSGKRRHHQSDALMADIVAKRLFEHLQLSGYVVMKRPPVAPHSTSVDHRG